jgi:hypothetical protein
MNEPSLQDLVSMRGLPLLSDNRGEDAEMEHTLTECEGEESERGVDFADG